MSEYNNITLPDDIIYIILHKTNIPCHICDKKLDLFFYILLKNKYYFCSKLCYLFF